MWRGLNWAGVHPVYREPRHSGVRVKRDERDMGKSGSHELFYLKPTASSYPLQVQSNLVIPSQDILRGMSVFLTR